MFRIGGKTFYDQKNKIPMKIPEFKRSEIGLIAEFCGIPNGFPNQGTMAARSALPKGILPFFVVGTALELSFNVGRCLT